MSNKPCWYKRDSQAKWECGFFHQWSQSHEEYENGPEHFPAAIVEDARTQECHVVNADHVSFANDPPEAFAEKIIEGMMSSDYRLPSKRGLMDEKPKRFKPRLEWVGYQWLVQVHPETIEVFNDNAEYVCQVRWIDGKMDYTQGGLPLTDLEIMFKKANA